MYSFKTKLFIVITFFFALSAGLHAQSVKGVVKDGSNGETLVGANVVVEGTSRGTSTDLDGEFTLDNVEVGGVLEISFTGLRTQTIEVDGETEYYEITLEADADLLDEVVVVGYGRQKKKVATGSISTISQENIEGFITPDIQNTLEGQVTGLVVNESSGQPGAKTSILIRGVSTNGDNTPLFIVDGLQIFELGNINTSDIESISVLKDAASTAIYGARAANGVVIITTKKGGKEGTFSYETNFSTSRPWRLPEVLGRDDYITLTREKFENDERSNLLESANFPEVGDADVPNTNWMDQIFNDANFVNHKVSAAIENAFLSLEYSDQNGVIGGDKSTYTRYAARLNSRKKINQYITVGENAYFNRVENRQIAENNAFGTVLANAFVYDPITAPFNDEKQYGFEQSPWVQKEYFNPLSRIFIQNDKGFADQLLGNVYAEITPFANLTFKTDAGIELTWNNFRNFTPDYDFHPAAQKQFDDISQGYEYNEAIQFENYLNYRDTIDLYGEHHLDVVGGMSYRTSVNERAGGSSRGIPEDQRFNENFQFIDAALDSNELSYGGKRVDYRLISFFGRIQYDYEDKYLMTMTLRRDGSSNFGSNNRFGLFPSASVGWVVSEEPFFQSVPYVSFLKLRGSWGINGNDRISELAFASRIINASTYSFGQDHSLIRGSALETPANPNIKWEESVQIDLGVELGLFNDKLSIEADWYQKTTKDLLMNEQIPAYIGATNLPISNLGEIQNQGIELGVGYRYTYENFSLQTNFTYTTFTNEVKKIAGGADFIPGYNWPVRNIAISRMTVGKPIGHFVGYKTEGIYQTELEVLSNINNEGDPIQPRAKPGDLIFVDMNGDGKIDSDDLTDIGSPWPDHILGLNLSANYDFGIGGRVDFSFVLSAQLGHDIYRVYERSDITYTNYQSFWLDRWTPDNPSTTLPRLTVTDGNNNQSPSDFYVEDASFLRLRNLQVGYTVAPEWLAYVKMKSLRLYFSANNLFTFTEYRGFDPDIGTSGDDILDTGIDKGFYPSSRSFGGGLSVTF